MKDYISLGTLGPPAAAGDAALSRADLLDSDFPRRGLVPVYNRL